jgi:hypothetical protein
MVTQGRHGIREDDNEFSSHTGAGLLQRDPTIPVKRHVDEKKPVRVVLPVKGQCSAGHGLRFLCFNRGVHSTPRPVEPFPPGRAGWDRYSAAGSPSLEIWLLWNGCSVGPGIARCEVHFAAAVTDNGRTLTNRE